MVKVFGHISPDTDATCCALIWAWYLNEHTSQEAQAFVQGELNTETQFVLSRWQVTQPELLALAAGDNVVIVDTNNPQELPDNLSEATILNVIDHHKLFGGIATDAPITMTLRPLASTASVMYDLMGEHAKALPEHIAGLMLSCILSDTLEFRSPTTTPHDKEIAELLAKQLGINMSDYAMEMFAAKSDVSSFTDSGLVKLDSKKVEVGGTNLRVSVVETTLPATILERKAGIVSAIKETIAAESDVDEVLFFIVDILNEEATVLTYNELTQDIVSKSFGVTTEGDTEVLPGVVSRKKQIIPNLKL